MAILKLPKVGTNVKYRTSSYETEYNGYDIGLYVGAYCDRYNQYYIILNNGHKVVNNYNFQYIEFSRVDHSSLSESDYETVLDHTGNPIDYTKFYETDETDTQYKILWVQDSYSGSINNSFRRKLACRAKGKARGYTFIDPDKLKLATPKPRMTKAQRQALIDRNAALEYIFKICTGLGYDASLFTEEKVNELADAYKVKTKSELNKLIMDFFDSASQNNVVDFKDAIANSVKFSDKFSPKDSEVENAKHEIECLQSDISNFSWEIDQDRNRLERLNTRIYDYTNLLSNSKTKLAESELKLNEVLAKTNVLALRQNTIDKIYSGLNTVIKDIVEQSGGFYRLDSVMVTNGFTDIDSLDLLSQIKVRFRTNRVFVRDFNAPRLCFDAGEFYVDWYPFASETRNRDLKFNPELVRNEPPVYPVRYKDNTIIGQNMHPHIKTHGHICWGEAYQTKLFSEVQHNSNYEFTGKPYVLFNKLKGIMLTYNGGSPFELLTNFLLKRDPTFKNRLETEYRNANRSLILFKNRTSGEQYTKMSEMYFNEIHDLSIVSVRDADGRLLDVDNRSQADTMSVKTYIKRYVGISSLTPRGERDKRYIKLKNNQFVELKTDSQFTTSQEVSNVSL